MTRLIDADALLEAIHKIYGANHAPQGIINLITNAPTVQREERDKLVDKTNTVAATLRPIDIEKLAEKIHENCMYGASVSDIQDILQAYAAKVLEDKEREITELKECVANYQRWLSGGVYYTNDEAIKLHDDYNNKIIELQAHINDLREALEDIRQHTFDIDAAEVAIQALSKTLAQSLAEHDNELIERCAKVCENNDGSWADYIWNQAVDNCAVRIRELKANHV